MERLLPGLTALPRPVFARAEDLSSASWTRVHAHPWVQLSYATQGVLGVRTRLGSYLAPPQRAIWVPPGLDHSVVSTERTRMRSLYIRPEAIQPEAIRPGAIQPEAIQPEAIQGVSSWAAKEKECRVLGVTPLVRELIRAVTRLPADYDEAGPDGRLVAVLLDQLAGLREVRFSLPLPADERLMRLSAGLEEHPDDPSTLAELAATAGLSARTMTRLFLRETGLTFRSWRRRLRLLKSLDGLEAGSSVTAVALDSGYTSTSAFIAAFRKEFGATPREAVQAAPLPESGTEP